MATESELIERVQSGSLQDFESLYTRHLKGVYGFIFYRVMDRMTAEDLTSQTFLKALENIGSYNPRKGAFSTWLYRIARNTVTDHYRTLKRHDDIEDVWDLPSEDNPFLDASAHMEAAEIHSVLQTLDKAKRELILMRLWDGLSYKEIAELTGKSEASCKMAFSRAMETLRKGLSPVALLLLILFPPLP
jgi:RNA polymerase sigma-70 factor, ECF subfamily